MNQRFLFFLSLLLLSISACLPGDEGITIEGAWTRPGVEGENSAIYLHITNHDDDDYWISAESRSADRIELHRSTMQEDGTMKMVRQENIPLPRGERVVLEPGGLHVMLIDLDQTLEPGDMISLTLIFQDHERIYIDVPVRNP